MRVVSAAALANGNAMQDIAMDEIRPGRTGNEILASDHLTVDGHGKVLPKESSRDRAAFSLTSYAREVWGG